MLVLLLASCDQMEPRYAGCVEQEFVVPNYYEKQTKLFTYVWYRDKIVESWADPAETITDSLAQARKEEGLSLLRVIKSVDVEPITQEKTGLSKPFGPRHVIVDSHE